MEDYQIIKDLKKYKEDIVVFGFGIVGKRMVPLFLENNINIKYICDNDENKQGQFYEGIEIVSLEKLKDNSNYLFIICNEDFTMDIVEQLEDKKLNYICIARAVFAKNEDIYGISRDEMRTYVQKNTAKLLEDKKNIVKFKDIHKNKRCFVIGNGPSLRASDLDRLKNEYTFAVNKIFEIYNQTEWRPTYYSTGDIKGYYSIFCRDKTDIGCKQKFLCLHHQYVELISDDILIIERTPFKKGSADFKFSVDPAKGFYLAGSSLFLNLELAVYMGFNEIILLGVDNSYAYSEQVVNGNVNNNSSNHFYPVTNEETKLDHCAEASSGKKRDLAYSVAREFAENNGIKIYNATRGGKLETLERIDFDTLF